MPEQAPATLPEEAGAAPVSLREAEPVAPVVEATAPADAPGEAPLAPLERELGEARLALAAAEARARALDEKLQTIAAALSRRNHLWASHQGDTDEVGRGARSTQQHKVSASAFIIGREPLSCNLRIEHWAVAPIHAKVEFLDGQYWLIATGPENLIFHNGQRVQRKSIAHNDAFWIGGHEVRFTYDDEGLRRALETMMEGMGR
jgi:hypothetical protein